MPCFSQTQTFLGTPISVRVVASLGDRSSVDEAIQHAFDEAERIEKCYSRFSETSELSALNRSVGQWVVVSDELYRLLELGQELHQRSSGAFDLSVKTILEGWGYDAEYSLQEKEQGFIGAFELQKPNRVRLTAPVDLGALGKGYALDCMDVCLREFEHVSLDAGGDLLFRGLNEERKPWRVLFEHPTDPTQTIGFVEVTNKALASSSPSRRRWRNRHHLVNPATGAPADQMLATYVQASTALLADAYSTVLFVMGFDRAKAALPEFPVEAMLISPRGEIHRSDGFEGELFMG